MYLAKTALNDFISLLFPDYCLACAGFIVKGEQTMCTRCLTELPKTSYHLRSDNPIKNRLLGRLPLTYGWAYLRFRKSGIVQHLMHQLKYNNCPEVGIRLGMAYGHEIIHAGMPCPFDMIVPVPLHATRQRQRGYNQAAKFAEGLSEALSIPWDESITMRSKATATQTRKSKSDRWENVRDVFIIKRGTAIENKRILLVDDVITTGATLEACGQHLLQCGCAELSIACLAEAQ